MSFYFDLSPCKAMTEAEFRKLFDGVDCEFTGITESEAGELTGATLWRPGVSTRGAHYYRHQDDKAEVGVNAFGTAVDAELTVVLAANVARATGSVIHPEDIGDEKGLTPDEVLARYGRSWAEQFETQGGIVLKMAEQEGKSEEILKVFGTHHPFSVGPKTRARLTGQSDEDKLKQLHRICIELQMFVAREDVFIPSVMEISKKEDGTGAQREPVTGFVLSQGVVTMAQDAEFTILRDDENGIFWLRTEIFREIAQKNGYRFFDDIHFLIKDLPQDLWQALISQSKPEPYF